MRYLILASTVLLGACAVHAPGLKKVDSVSSTDAQARWEVQRAQAASIRAWKIKGKISLKAGSKGGHATLRWNRTTPGQHIELYGPLGGGRVVVDRDANGARLKDTKGGDLSGDSVATLIEQRLGWPLPFDLLPFWLRGLPAADDADMQWDDQGRVLRMNDQGWQVSYPEYQSIKFADGRQLDLPRQIELNALPGTLRVYDKNGDFLGEDLFIRLIIKSWLP